MPEKCIIIFFIVAIFAIAVSTGLSTVTSITAIIIDEKIKPDKVVDSDGNVYVVIDQVILGEVSAAKRFQQLKEDTRYKVKTTGIRFPLFGWYPNIVRYEKQ